MARSAAMLLVAALGSCSRAVKLSVLDPAQLVAMPASGASHEARFMRRDSVATLDDGLLICRGDSMRIYARAEPVGASLHVPQPGLYRLERSGSSVRVLGFVPAGGLWRDWEGDLSVSGDSLEFLRRAMRARGLRRGSPAETLRTSPQAITRVDLEQTEAGHTIVVITLVAAVIAGIAVLALGAGLSGIY
jgi:hypothetical protein